MTLSSSLGGGGRSSVPPLEVRLLRNGIAESRHRVHAVVCDSRGRVLMRAGDPQHLSFIRSAQKPFQATVFVSSGAADQGGCGDRGLAIACASHAGTANHAREAFRLLWSAELEPELLQCPVPSSASSPLEHNCSGKHAAFLASCRRLGWSAESYLQPDHPLQQQVLQRTAELLGLPAAELVQARDDCGAPTVQLQLAQMALLYAHLGAGEEPVLERLSRAMLAHAAEALDALGSPLAEHLAVALHLLEQLDWLTPMTLEDLRQQFNQPAPHLRLDVQGELRFD